MKSLSLIALLCIITIFSTCKTEQTGTLPNILWITCEDISPFLGCYGDSLASTPNLDMLAEDGVLYTNFYANAPVCAPARFTILTGVHASSAGTMNMRSQYRIPSEWKTYPEFLKEAGYYCTNNSKTDYNHFEPDNFWDESSRNAHYKNRAPGQPFFAIFNFTSSHESKIFNYKVEELDHNPDDMFLPPYLPDLPEVREDMAKLYDNITFMDSQVGEILAELDELGQKDSTIVFYYSDHGGVYPRAKRFIHRSGTWVPLIIKFPEMYAHLESAEAGNSIDNLTSFVDLAPTLLSLAGIDAPEYMEGRAFLGEHFQDPQNEIYLFRNRMDERIDFMRAVTDGQFRYQANYMPYRPYGQHLDYLWRAASVQAWEQAYKDGKCNPAQSAYWEEKPIEEMYDMINDPWEINNLANNPDYSEELEGMRDKLSNRMVVLNDAGFIPEGMMKEINDSIELYNFTRSDFYPLEKLIDLMSARFSSDTEYIDALQNGLIDENPIIRYWSAVNCISIPDIPTNLIARLKNNLNDNHGEVVLASCEALYKSGEVDLVLPEIKKQLGSTNEWVVLMALNIIEYFEKEDQLALLPIFKELSQTAEVKYIVRAADHLIGQLETIKDSNPRN